MSRFQEIFDAIDKKIVKTGKAYWQPGKTVCYSLFAHPPLQISEVAIEVSELVSKLSDEFEVTSAVLALNIYPKNVHKGTGLNWLAEITGISIDEMAGVGDSAGDIDFLRLVGKSAAPANAVQEVKDNVHYVSAQEAAEGLDDILNYWGL
jgi:hydroxymethylpyrimidine pyrophosphatase-like HAD family hydrolase